MKKLSKSLVLLAALTPLMVFSAEKPATTDTKAATNSAAPVKAADKLDALFGGTIVAKGKGVSVTRAQLDEALVGIKSRAAAAGQSIPTEQMAQLEQQILQRLIQVQLLNAKATDADRATAKEQVAKRMTELKTQAGSEDMLAQKLKSVGLTRDELVSKMTEEATAEAALKREVKSDVSDADVKKYYDDHPARFEQPELVHAAHILLMTQDPTTGGPLTDDQKAAKKKQIEDILKRAKGGEDFAKLAKEFSEDPGSKENGGEYTFPRGQMVPEFETTAFSLGTNQISDVVTTQYGYHVIKVYDKIPAKTAALDDEVSFAPPPSRYLVIKKMWKGPAEVVESSAKLSSLIREKLEADSLQQAAPDYLKKLDQEAKVEILDEKLKPEPESAMPGSNAMPGLKAPSTDKTSGK